MSILCFTRIPRCSRFSHMLLIVINVILTILSASIRCSNNVNKRATEIRDVEPKESLENIKISSFRRSLKIIFLLNPKISKTTFKTVLIRCSFTYILTLIRITFLVYVTSLLLRGLIPLYLK